MSKKYDWAVFIGRMQPPHQGHIDQIRRGLQLADKVVIALGSHRAARNIKNPWTASERQQMIEACLTPDEACRIAYVAVRDYYYNDLAWFTDLYNTVETETGPDARICLLGTQKDASSWYLEVAGSRWAPEFEGLHHKDWNSTQVREDYFGEWFQRARFPSYVPLPVQDWLLERRETGPMLTMREEWRDIHDYKLLWTGSPFPPTFITTDAVVIQNAHVLLVRRKGAPGKGQLALPGGFLKEGLSLKESMLEELREETNIKLTGGTELLRKSIGESKAFDSPNRSTRGRTVTHAFLIHLPDGPELPIVRGGDDAASASWLPLADLGRLEDQFYEDHLHIIEYFARRF